MSERGGSTESYVYYGIWGALPINLEYFGIVSGILGLISPSWSGLTDKIPFVRIGPVNTRTGALKRLLISLGYTADEIILTFTTGIGAFIPYTFDKETIQLLKKFFKSATMGAGEEQAELDDPYYADGGRGSGSESKERVNGSQEGKRFEEFNKKSPDGVKRNNYGDVKFDPGEGPVLPKIGNFVNKFFINKYILLVPLILLIGMFVTDSGYGNAVADQLGFQAAGVDMDAPVNMARQGIQTVQCLGNVACMREWQFNNTERPGSEEVGEEYSLEIEEFGVNDGYDLDVAYRNASSNVPVSFSVYNPRNGLKGIKARNVKYRIRVMDSGVGGECSTGWLDLNGTYADDENSILPGGYATPLQQPEALTLEGCGLLQPALGIDNKVEFQVKYDYSSQATLYFEAMSQENMRSQGMRPEPKKSETARTPVQTYINVESPVTYSEDTGRSLPFSIQVGFETNSDNIDYKVEPNDLTLISSSETQISEGAGVGCQGLDETVEEDEYRLSGDQRRVIEQRQENRWFGSNTGPSPASCTMELENPSSISRTGETLTMRIDANYTVRLTEQQTGFRTYNGRCEESGMECPMLVPEEVKENNGGDGSHLISKCDTSKRLDANNGCGIRNGTSNQDWTIINWINGDDNADSFSYDRTVETDETAMYWKNAKEEVIEEVVGNVQTVPNGYLEYEQDGSMSSHSGIGWDAEEFNEIEDERGIGLIADDNDIEFLEIDHKVCRSEETSDEYIRDITSGGNPLYILIEEVNCQQRLEEKYGFDWSECFVDGYSEYVQSVTGWNLVTEGQLIGDAPNECSSAQESISQCSGVRGWDPEDNEAVCIEG